VNEGQSGGGVCLNILTSPRFDRKLLWFRSDWATTYQTICDIFSRFTCRSRIRVLNRIRV